MTNPIASCPSPRRTAEQTYGASALLVLDHRRCILASDVQWDDSESSPTLAWRSLLRQDGDTGTGTRLSEEGGRPREGEGMFDCRRQPQSG
uniref:Uncharacterized protein n=1 Tax=Mycena chlorophos TaxID=658473 RepID=A0ABQ0L7E1_MYCCL|nr:predicted protein [Mycena chlorophos]